MADPAKTPLVYNIVTLKWGDRYGGDYVNRLYRAVRRHTTLPIRCVCFTDDPTGIDDGIDCFNIPEIDLPPKPMVTGWRKLCLFRNDLPISGPSMFLDLDLVIRGNIDAFLTYEPDKIPIIHNWVGGIRRVLNRRPNIGNSSVFRWRANECGYVYEQFLGEKEWALANFSPPQSYLTHCIREQMVFYPESWTRSFKRHVRPFFPLNLLVTPREPSCPIVVFHGRPDPEEVVEGYRGKKPHHHCKPAPWIEKHWK